MVQLEKTTTTRQGRLHYTFPRSRTTNTKGNHVLRPKEGSQTNHFLPPWKKGKSNRDWSIPSHVHPAEGEISHSHAGSRVYLRGKKIHLPSAATARQGISMLALIFRGLPRPTSPCSLYQFCRITLLEDSKPTHSPHPSSIRVFKFMSDST